MAKKSHFQRTTWWRAKQLLWLLSAIILSVGIACSRGRNIDHRVHSAPAAADQTVQFGLTDAEVAAQLSTLVPQQGFNIDFFSNAVFAAADSCATWFVYNTQPYIAWAGFNIAAQGIIHTWKRHVAYVFEPKRTPQFTTILRGITQQQFNILFVAMTGYLMDQMQQTVPTQNFFWQNEQNSEQEFYISWHHLLSVTGIAALDTFFNSLRVAVLERIGSGRARTWSLIPNASLGGFKIIVKYAVMHNVARPMVKNFIPMDSDQWQQAVQNYAVNPTIIHTDLRRLLQTNDGRPPHYLALDSRYHDATGSCKRADWAPQRTKASCDPGTGIAGLAQDGRVLCRSLSVRYGHNKVMDHLRTVVADVDNFPNTGSDWASGLSKTECPVNFYMMGISLANGTLSGSASAACLPIKSLINNQHRVCRTVRFDSGDNRSTSNGGDFAPHSYKGQCSDEEYVAGFARQGDRAAALLCCRP